MTAAVRASCALLVALLAASLAAAGCGGDDGGADTGPGSADVDPNATRIEATMGDPSAGEYSFVLADTVPAGAVVFAIENLGELPHEFEVVKTELAADQLPVADGKADVEAEGGEELGEVEDIEPGAAVELAVDLEPGAHLVVCNLPGHYEQGMVHAFTVE